MKKLIFFFLFIGGVLLNAKAQTVYVTESGKKYHAKNCSIVKSGKKGMELKEAVKKGYTACAQCKAPKEEAEKKKTPAPAKPTPKKK